MVAILTFPALIEAANRVGVDLHTVSSDGNLYVWHTPVPERAVIYIGKSASDKRLADEETWRDGADPKYNIRSGIVSLLRANEAEKQALYYDPDTFDAGRWRKLREDWDGDAFLYLDEALPDGEALTAEDVEQLLVRIAIRYGVPIGNSQFASQWENPIGSIPDTLAVLAVGADSSWAA